MSESIQPIRPNPQGSDVAAAQPTRGASGLAPSDAVSGGSVAFRALLERLEESAADLQRDGAGIGNAEELASAVARARDSFGEALELGRDLLESLQQAQIHESKSKPDRSR